MAILERINGLFKKGDGIDISDYLDDVVFLKTDDRDEALGILVDRLVADGKVQDGHLFYEAILRREDIVSTGIGMGVAIPHAKLDCFDDFFIAVGIQQGSGIEWDALDGAPVRLIFLIGGPANAQTDYLGILSHLTVAIKDQVRRNALLSAVSKAEVKQIFDNC